MNPSAKDAFRRAGGYEAVLQTLQSNDDTISDSAEQCLAIRGLLRLLSTAFRGHRGNKKYFATYLDGWTHLHRILDDRITLLLSLNGPAATEILETILDGLLVAAAETDDDASAQQPFATDSQRRLHQRDGSATGIDTLSFPMPCAIALRLAVDRVQIAPHESVDAGVASAEETLAASASRFLALVSDLANRTARNAVGLWQTGVLIQLLSALHGECIPQEALMAVTTLAARLAQFGLTSLDDVADLFQRACVSERARELLLNSMKESKQPPFIQFDLTLYGYSSLEFACLPRSFPPLSGYTLSAWLRIDDFDASSHTTVFGAFDQSQSCFILLYLEKDSQQLILQTSVRSSRPSVRFKSTRFVSGQWYHVALVQRRNTSEPHQSAAALFVDGEFKEQIKCAYPETPPEYEERPNGFATAAQSVPISRRQKPVQAFFGTPHDLALRHGRNEVLSKWKLANAHLYQTPLTDEFIAVQYHLGPRYVGNMQDCLGPLLTYTASAELNRYNELLHPDKLEKSDIVTATEGRGSEVVPESKLLISICASAAFDLDASQADQEPFRSGLDRRASHRLLQLSQQSNTITVNAATPSLSEAILRPYGTGILTGAPVVAQPKALDDMSWSLAGSLPVLVRLLEAANSQAAFMQSVHIFFECIKDNWRISEAMEKSNGFGVLATLIRQKLGLETGWTPGNTRSGVPALDFEGRQTLPIGLLRSVLAFVGYDEARPESSMIVNPMAYRVLMLDFDTWRRCDLDTQKLYYVQFTHFVSQNRHHAFNQKRLARMRVVRKMIEAMKSEDFAEEVLPDLISALRALVDNTLSGPLYRDLAMFVAFGLQEERSMLLKPMRNMATVASFRQRAATWARSARGSQPASPVTPSAPSAGLSRADLAIHVLTMLESILSDERNLHAIRRFQKAVPNRWLLHLLAESDKRVIILALRILSQMLLCLGQEFKGPFMDKNGGFVTLQHRVRASWRLPAVWQLCFAIFFGRPSSITSSDAEFTVFGLINMYKVNDDLQVGNPEMLATIMGLLETGLRSIVKTDEPDREETSILKTVVQFLNELYERSAGFRDFAANSRYVQEILFVLFPILVGSDRLSSETELQSENGSLSFHGEEVTMRPHSNSLGARPPSVRSLTIDNDKRAPSPRSPMRVQAPRRLSSFVYIRPDANGKPVEPAHFNAVMAPAATEPVNINVGNSIVESLLEVATNLFIDQVCNKDKFIGIGLFLKVPPGFREHQAYFESYVLVHTLTQLWNHLRLNQSLLVNTRVITNLSRFCMHMAEAVFEGWFLDGAQPLLDFSGKVLEYLQQPDIASVKVVRLCSQNINAIRVVFLRVCLWRLSELDESQEQAEATAFLHKMDYWQIILFASDNQETLFIRLICFLLYLKLVSDVSSVRHAAVRLWRTILMQKPTETATLLTLAMGPEQQHLSTGFMKLVSMDDEDFIVWVDEHRPVLDKVFTDALNKSWEDFVSDENRRTEESAKNRLSKRKDKLRQWQVEENGADDFMHRYEVSTHHWRSNVHAQERLKLQRSVQDHQESVNHLLTVFAGIERVIRQPCGLDPPQEASKWQLDETEAVNRMRLRTLPEVAVQKDAFQPKRKLSGLKPLAKLVVNTQIDKTIREDILSPLPPSPLTPGFDDATNGRGVDGARNRSESVSTSQLLEGGFEMVEDPREADDGLLEDKNRKVMTSLQRGDMVQQLYNISRIVGLEACEGLVVIGKKCLYMQDNFFQRSDGEIVSVTQAPTDERDPYVQLISGKDVGTERTKHSTGDQETRHWTWASVLSISKRRFLFRDVSVEVFFSDGRSYLLTCISSKVRDELYSAITGRAPHVHSSVAAVGEDAWRLDTLRNPEEVPQSLGSKFASVFNSAPTHHATKKWVKGEMSNFQYLMLVNTMAGRTFNDLTQYPVFPWVLADYSSDVLDLNDPKTFRDLSKPMGCQTPARELEYKDRFKQFAEMGDHNAPPFHYGTHYSSAMIVSSYLIRLQPFVQSYLLLQGGSFDHADRLFDSIEKAWLSSSKDNMTDVRELTPEFFYLPEFLVNANGYDFGAKQVSGEVVNDVKLPPWAKGDPHIFVARHREALESPYVSEHLHEWIDLVFGYKQRGEAAIDATNVFQHLSYQGAKDLDSIDDPVERLASIGIIRSFGQTPYQVFQRSHPGREQLRAGVVRLDTLTESLIRLPEPLFEIEDKVSSLSFSPTQERLLCAGPCKLNMMPNGDRFMQWSFADHSVRFFSANTKRPLGLDENMHVGSITAATLADSKTLVTAGADCTVGLWTVSTSRDLISVQPKTYLFGHRKPVTILAASRVFSTLLSASTDGHILIWSLNRSQSIRVLHPPGSAPVQAAQISNTSGHILLCQGAHLLLYTLNGHLLVKQRVGDSDAQRPLCCAFYDGAANEWLERELVFTGHARGLAHVWSLAALADGAWHLLPVKRLLHTEPGRDDPGPLSAAITAILPMPHAVYTGDEDGRVWQWDCVVRQTGSGARAR